MATSPYGRVAELGKHLKGEHYHDDVLSMSHKIGKDLTKTSKYINHQISVGRKKLGLNPRGGALDWDKVGNTLRKAGRGYGRLL